MRKTEVMTKLKRNQKGITLIALVITIIVLLILAGVAISMLSGENGILKQAAEAKTKTDKKTEEEQIQVAVLAAMTNKDHKIDKEALDDALEDIGYPKSKGNDKYGYEVTVNDKTTYKIQGAGEVVNETNIDEELDSYFKKTNSSYKCKNGYITGIPVEDPFAGVEAGNLMDALPTGYKVGTKDGEEVKARDKILATGMSIIKDGKIVARIVIFGDVDGHLSDYFAVDSSDMYYTQCWIEKVNEYEELIDCNILAMDVDHNGVIDMEDYTTISNYSNYMGVEIVQSEYVSEDIIKELREGN